MNASRQSISSESLKRVIIRYDFKGVTSIDTWVSDIKTKFCSKLFKQYNIGEHGQATIDINLKSATIIQYTIKGRFMSR